MELEQIGIFVGRLFAPPRTQWIDNSFELRYENGQLLLQLCWPSPSEGEIDRFQNGAINIALLYEQNVIFFCFRIEGTQDWSDQGFSVRLCAEESQAVLEPDQFYHLMHFVLVDSRTGIVRGIRGVTMSPRFSSLFRQKLKLQKELPFDRAEHFAAVDRVYQKYPDSKRMVRAALIQEKAGVTIK